jgi:hypothetical protein
MVGLARRFIPPEASVLPPQHTCFQKGLPGLMAGMVVMYEPFPGMVMMICVQ